VVILTFESTAAASNSAAQRSNADASRVAALALLLVVLGLGLLYAYRSQTPSVPEVDLSQAVQDTNSGRVRAVTIASNKATLEFRDNATHREQATLPEPDTVLARAVSDYNAAHPSQAIELRYVPDDQSLGVLGSILLSLLPVFLIGGLFYYMLMRARRGS